MTSPLDLSRSPLITVELWECGQGEKHIYFSRTAAGAPSTERVALRIQDIRRIERRRKAGDRLKRSFVKIPEDVARQHRLARYRPPAGAQEKHESERPAALPDARATTN